MNKAEFVKHMAEQHQCTQVEAEKTIDMFTSSVIDAIGKGNEISLIGFGNFSV
jgi:DNA-binding protein HU-beta